MEKILNKIFLSISIIVFLYFTYLNSLNGRYIETSSGGENGSTSIIDTRTGQTFYPLPNVIKKSGADWVRQNIYLFKSDSLIQSSPPIKTFFNQ
jgi:hypothetical protein